MTDTALAERAERTKAVLLQQCREMLDAHPPNTLVRIGNSDDPTTGAAGCIYCVDGVTGGESRIDGDIVKFTPNLLQVHCDDRPVEYFVPPTPDVPPNAQVCTDSRSRWAMPMGCAEPISATAVAKICEARAKYLKIETKRFREALPPGTVLFDVYGNVVVVIKHDDGSVDEYGNVRPPWCSTEPQDPEADTQFIQADCDGLPDRLCIFSEEDTRERDWKCVPQSMGPCDGLDGAIGSPPPLPARRGEFVVVSVPGGSEEPGWVVTRADGWVLVKPLNGSCPIKTRPSDIRPIVPHLLDRVTAQRTESAGLKTEIRELKREMTALKAASESNKRQKRT